jgi:hypothetical protein
MLTTQDVDLWRPSGWQSLGPSFSSSGRAAGQLLQSGATISRKRPLGGTPFGSESAMGASSSQWASRNVACSLSTMTFSRTDNPTVHTGVTGRFLPYSPSHRLDLRGYDQQVVQVSELRLLISGLMGWLRVCNVKPGVY